MKIKDYRDSVLNRGLSFSRAEMMAACGATFPMVRRATNRWRLEGVIVCTHPSGGVNVSRWCRPEDLMRIRKEIDLIVPPKTMKEEAKRRYRKGAAYAALRKRQKDEQNEREYEEFARWPRVVWVRAGTVPPPPLIGPRSVWELAA